MTLLRWNEGTTANETRKLLCQLGSVGSDLWPRFVKLHLRGVVFRYKLKEMGLDSFLAVDGLEVDHQEDKIENFNNYFSERHTYIVAHNVGQ